LLSLATSLVLVLVIAEPLHEVPTHSLTHSQATTHLCSVVFQLRIRELLLQGQALPLVRRVVELPLLGLHHPSDAAHLCNQGRVNMQEERCVGWDKEAKGESTKLASQSLVVGETLDQLCPRNPGSLCNPKLSLTHPPFSSI
jgi:hypothetical protein